MTLSNVIVEFYEKMSTWEGKVVDGSGLSLPHMHTIEILGVSGKLRMKELAAKIGVTTGTLTITIDKLEKKGFVERIPNPDDRRSYFITLTNNGIKVHQKHNLAHEEMTTRCIEGLSKNSVNNLIETLGLISSKINL